MSSDVQRMAQFRILFVWDTMLYQWVIGSWCFKEALHLIFKG